MKKWFKQEAAFLLWAAIVLCMSVSYLIVNCTMTHYHGIEYNLPTLLKYLPLGTGFILISIYLRGMSQRFSLLFDVLGKMYWAYLLFAFGCYAVQFTPFPLASHSVLVFDQMLGFSLKAVYHFTMAHSWIKHIANWSYSSLTFQFYSIPLLLALLLEKKSLRIFFIANLISVVVAYNIYYFFPTTVPAQVLPNMHFLPNEYRVVAQWYEIHLHLKNYVHIGALIDLPSYHVIWAVFLTYACKNRKWLFYPIAILNVSLIASTMELGWHLLGDVLCGFVVAAISIYVAEICDRDRSKINGHERVLLAV